MLQIISDFFVNFAHVVPRLLVPLLLAWAVTCAILAFGLRVMKEIVRPRVLRVDESVRAWARALRYDTKERVVETAPNAPHDSPAEPLIERSRSERVLLTWFFRFWTNFASAPSLSFFSLAVPLWIYAWLRRSNPHGDLDGSATFDAMRLWLLPGLCYGGSMLLSFVLKRVFKRIRPVREGGAFGHKLKDHSFPSGHSLTSFCFWIMLAIVAALSGWASGPLVLLTVCAVAIVALTGLSRVYMGVHFPSDVLGGFVIGATWCAICFFLLQKTLANID